MQQPSGCLLSLTAPLLKEKRDALITAERVDVLDPTPVHRPGMRTRFSPDDHPGDSGEIYLTEIFQERLDRQEPYARSSFSEVIDSRKSVFSVLDADTPPDMLHGQRIVHRPIHVVSKALSTLGKNLIGVPVRLPHDVNDACHVFVRDRRVKEIAHRIHEDTT